MAITQRQIGAGVGGGSVGLVGAEALFHAQEADMIDARTGRIIAGSAAATSMGLTAASVADLVPLSPETTAFIAGVGAGSTAWYVGRDAGVAPRIAVDVPEEVNLVGPIVTGTLIGVVGIAASTITGSVF